MADIDLAVSATGIGMRALEKSATRPKHFSDEALKTSRRLIQLVNESSAGKARLRFGQEIVIPSSMLVANVDSLVKGNLPSIGSIDGKLISVSGENGSYTIHIHDRLRGRRVRCSIPEDVLPRALRAFESRIIARGIIYGHEVTDRRFGSILRDFDIVPPEEQLPQAARCSRYSRRLSEGRWRLSCVVAGIRRAASAISRIRPDMLTRANEY